MSQRDRAELERWVLSPSMPAGLVMRVRVVLATADGAAGRVNKPALVRSETSIWGVR
jgi:hypothetical protein